MFAMQMRDLTTAQAMNRGFEQASKVPASLCTCPEGPWCQICLGATSERGQHIAQQSDCEKQLGGSVKKNYKGKINTKKRKFSWRKKWVEANDTVGSMATSNEETIDDYEIIRNTCKFFS